jgi:hypothetical protein
MLWTIAMRRDSGYGSLEPGRQYPTFDRPTAGPWERVELRRVGLDYFARFIDANRAITFAPDGSIETRPTGTTGPWETLRAATNAEGRHLLYRPGAACVLFEVL